MRTTALQSNKDCKGQCFRPLVALTCLTSPKDRTNCKPTVKKEPMTAIGTLAPYGADRRFVRFCGEIDRGRSVVARGKRLIVYEYTP
jgi:hypothetical protein